MAPADKLPPLLPQFGSLDQIDREVTGDLPDLDATDQSERVVDAIRATSADTEEDIAEMAADEAMTRRALDLLRCSRIRLTTAKAVKVGTRAGPFLKVYSRRWMVSMMAA